MFMILRFVKLSIQVTHRKKSLKKIKFFKKLATPYSVVLNFKISSQSPQIIKNVSTLEMSHTLNIINISFPTQKFYISTLTLKHEFPSRDATNLTTCPPNSLKCSPIQAGRITLLYSRSHSCSSPNR